MTEEFRDWIANGGRWAVGVFLIIAFAFVLILAAAFFGISGVFN